jgi:ATP-binding cassette subfamily F protein uup
VATTKKLPAREEKPSAYKVESKDTQKLSYKERRELEELPDQLAQLESEQRAISERLQDANLYKTQPDEVSRLNRRYTEIDGLLLAKLERWEALDSRSREI